MFLSCTQKSTCNSLDEYIRLQVQIYRCCCQGCPLRSNWTVVLWLLDYTFCWGSIEVIVCTGEDYILHVPSVYWDCTHHRHGRRGYMQCGWCYTTYAAAELCKRKANRNLSWPNLSSCLPKARASPLNNPGLPAETGRLDSYVCNLSPQLRDCLPDLYKPKVLLPGC